MLKRSIVTFLLSFVLRMAVTGQIILVPEVQSGGMVLRQQLYTLLVNNFSGSPKAGIFLIQVLDRSSSQILLEATSNLVQLNNGARRISYSELSPLQVSQSSPEFSMDKSLNLPLPVGDYLICYKLFNSENKGESLATECVKIAAQSLAPPQLITPANESSVSGSRPLLVWTPPAPVTMFSSLSYDVVLVEKFSDQSSEEAIQRNTPLLATSAFSTNLQYPASFINLEPGKHYAWQVVARDGNRYGGKSEAWSFTILPDSVKMIIETAAYVKIQEMRSEISVLHQGVLKIDYMNMFSDSVVKAEIKDISELGSKPIVFDINVSAGQNMIQQNIERLGKFQEGHVYRLTIYNSSKEELSFRFTPKYYF